MELGMIGLGRMGANMAKRLTREGHRIVAYDRDAEAVAKVKTSGIEGTDSIEAMIALLAPPRAIWCMLPSGGITENTVALLGDLLSPGDTVIDGGNSYFKDDVARAKALSPKQITYMDVGTSGGVWGAERGYCLMIGGDRAAFERLEPIFVSLAPGIGAAPRTPGRKGPETNGEHGYLHCGPAGAGHFVKMVHNGIEYGIMEAYAEGLDLMNSQASAPDEGDLRYDLDLTEISEVWRRGSVIGSWLLDLTAQALLEEPDLERFTGQVPDSGEGRWTVLTAVENAVSTPVLTAALYRRFRSRRTATFADRSLSAMREKFGGHKESS
jgi:6-phosphogluconate dehydrogenase